MEKDFDLFINVFPPNLGPTIREHKENLIEVILDLGRPLELRTEQETIRKPEKRITRTDIQHVLDHVGFFTSSDRAGVPGTLHRFSKIDTLDGRTVGLTCRIGKPFIGSTELVREYIKSKGSVLIIGKPCAGKTSSLRNIARILSDEYGERVIVVDKDLEIAGGGDTPHESVGFSRRMVVPPGRTQAQVMISAVENHYPSIVVCDELSNKEEAETVMTIAKRGVDIIATAHGSTLEDVLRNPALSKVLGNVKSVTLGDDEAKLRGTSKTILEREIEPIFDKVVEIHDFDQIGVYDNVRDSVDAILAGGVCVPKIYKLENGKISMIQNSKVSLPIDNFQSITMIKRKK